MKSILIKAKGLGWVFSSSRGQIFEHKYLSSLRLCSEALEKECRDSRVNVTVYGDYLDSSDLNESLGLCESVTLMNFVHVDGVQTFFDSRGDRPVVLNNVLQLTRVVLPYRVMIYGMPLCTRKTLSRVVHLSYYPLSFAEYTSSALVSFLGFLPPGLKTFEATLPFGVLSLIDTKAVVDLSILPDRTADEKDLQRCSSIAERGSVFFLVSNRLSPSGSYAVKLGSDGCISVRDRLTGKELRYMVNDTMCSN